MPRAGQGWKIWQYTETGTVPGIPSKNRVDLNVSRGSLAELRQPAHLGNGGGTVPVPRQPTAPPVAGAPVLKANSRGTDVLTAQELLNASGARIDADGVFGPATTAAVRSFQSAKKLPADGIVGPRTWSLLLTDNSGGSAGIPAGNAAALAKQLLGTPGITFARQHSETRRSASTAHANIVDMAAGRGALTSPGSHVGSKRVQLDPRMLRALLTLHDKHGYRMNISEFVGGVHSKRSRHYRGLSFDVNVITGARARYRAPRLAAGQIRCRRRDRRRDPAPAHRPRVRRRHRRRIRPRDHRTNDLLPARPLPRRRRHRRPGHLARLDRQRPCR